jgi:GNAT superfamily N-acetyltransferase
MSLLIRLATPADATAWLDLLLAVAGASHPARAAWSLEWAQAALGDANGEETWVAEREGKLLGSISVLQSAVPNDNPVANLGRSLFLPEHYQQGAAQGVLEHVCKLCKERGLLTVIRVPLGDQVQQLVLERLGFACVGFQPGKHLYRVREGALFYVRDTGAVKGNRLPLSNSLPQINELATAALANLNVHNPEILKDGATGYPLQSELKIEEGSAAQFQAAKTACETPFMPVEISGHYNHGSGWLRVQTDASMRVLLGWRDGRVVAGLGYYVDEVDRCVRWVDSFCADDISIGAVMNRAVEFAQQRLNALYFEVDFVMTAPRALKSAEQMGFVPVAYLPGFFRHHGLDVDLVKMVKLNAVYTLEEASLTPQARALVSIVDRNFQDQKVGQGVINLLRGLKVFEGLGDGELAKMARLFTQKLYRGGERVFEKGDPGDTAYVIMRGQIDIVLEPAGKPIASIGAGGIFGEQAFLEGAARTAGAVAAQPCILLLIQRSSFRNLVESEPHLGMVVMRNIALELSQRLRKATQALGA